jgi:hypothetical protein
MFWLSSAIGVIAIGAGIPWKYVAGNLYLKNYSNSFNLFDFHVLN